MNAKHIIREAGREGRRRSRRRVGDKKRSGIEKRTRKDAIHS